MGKIVWVVMGNDSPAAVYSTKEKAEDFIRRQQIEDEARAKREGDWGTAIYRRIHWRAHEFTLDEV